MVFLGVCTIYFFALIVVSRMIYNIPAVQKAIKKLLEI